MRRTCGVVCAALTGCAPLGRDEVAGIDVASAELDDVQIGSAAVVLGFAEGSGDLVIVDRSGESHLVPVSLGGGVIGVVFDLGASVDGSNSTELVLPDEPITGDQLLGTYDGTSADGILGFGVQSWHLKNPAGVELDHSWFSAGIGVMVDVAWLRIRVGAGSGDTAGTPTETGDTQPPPPDTAQPDTGDTGSPQASSTATGCEGSSGGSDGAACSCDSGCGGGCCGDSCSASGVALFLVPFLRSRRRG